MSKVSHVYNPCANSITYRMVEVGGFVPLVRFAHDASFSISKQTQKKAWDEK